MAIDRNPEPTNDELLRRRASQSDNGLQADPQLAEGPASGGRMAMYAIALIAILGVVFYGLNTSSTTPDATPTAQTTPASPSSGTAQAPRPPAGQTTGSSMTPSQPATPRTVNPSSSNPAPAAPQTNSGGSSN